MPLVPISLLGQIGVVKDVLPSELPINAWTDARNVSFRNGLVEKCVGQSEYLASPTAVPYALFATPSGTTNLWLYLGKAKAYAFSAAETDVTRVSSDYTGGETDLWNGGMFNGLGVFNNGVDNPQLWSPVAVGTKLVDLTNWPASTKAKVVRGFKNYLVALDVTKSSTRYPRMVKWSHVAAPGAVPSSWDETDATKDAGEVVLSEGEDELIDCAQLGDYNVLYTKGQTWMQALSGTASIFNFIKRLDASGILTQECAKPLPRRQHFVVTQDDIVVHDLSSVESVVDARLRNWIFNNLTSSAYKISRVVPFYRHSEMWFCFPYGGGGLLNMAAIWNWKYNTWTVRELPDIRAIASSLSNPTDVIDMWDYSGASDWTTSEVWDKSGQDSPSQELVMLSPRDTSGILKLETVYTFDGANYRSYVERTGLALIGQDRDGKHISDPNRLKMLTAVWPDIEAAAGSQISVYAGSHDKPNGTPTWQDPVTFTVGTDVKADIYASGRYLALRYEATAGFLWKLKSHALDIVPLGAL